MPIDVFDNFFAEYSKSNPSYFKLDSIIPNPAPPEIELTKVMMKMEVLLKDVLHLKTFSLPSP